MAQSDDPTEPKQTRIGEEYQAIVRPFDPNLRVERKRSAEESPILVWRPKKTLKTNSRNALDAYLNRVESHFTGNHRMDEARALYILLRANHNTKKALSYLQPNQAMQALTSERNLSSTSQGSERGVSRVAAAETRKSEPEPPKQTSERSSRHRARGSVANQAQFPEEIEHCFVCKHGGTVMLCDWNGCNRLYHAYCAGLSEVPEGEFFCLRHECALCGEPSSESLQCQFCPVSYCQKHSPLGNAQSNSSPFTCINCIKKHVSRAPFMKSLHSFHENPSSPPMQIPVVQGRPLDLWALYHSVITLGGFEAVNKDDLWRNVARHLGYVVDNEEPANHVKLAYCDLLLPYELAIFRPVRRQRKPRQPRVDADDKGADGTAWTPATVKGGNAPSTALVSAAAARASQLGELCWKTSLNESRAASSFPQQEQQEQEQYGALVLNSVTNVHDHDGKGEQVQRMDPHFTVYDQQDVNAGNDKIMII